MTKETTELKKTLGPFMLWGLGVGYVISGSYFGWNLGLPAGGPYGLMAAAIAVTVMYVSFVLSYAELSCAIPRAGGAFVYASRALGPGLGFLGGAAQLVEFVFAPPAIAYAIGSYFGIFFPSLEPLWIAIAAYLIFTGINIYGVRTSAIFELVITILAVFELLVFVGVAAPSFSIEAFTQDPLPNGWAGAFAAIPFAMWFYLAIEGIANVAEEARDPQRDLIKGFSWAMITLVFLATTVFFVSVGVDGWRTIVYPPGSTGTSDSPLPLALGAVVGADHPLYHMLVTFGLFGLIASFHGIILVAGRATLEFGRVGYAPALLGRTLQKRKTPAWALLANMAVGICALLTGKTGEIITLSVFGALTLYMISMISLFRLRRIEPRLKRPYRAPFYPWLPSVALVLSLVALGSMIVHQFHLFLVYVALLGAGYAWYYTMIPLETREQDFKKPIR